MPHPIQPYARAAFAAGWAASGGPMTERVKAASLVAVRLAVEQADRPDILEVTLKLGQLEGMWARLFDRREQLIRQYAKTVTAAWRVLIGPRLFRDGLHNFRADLGLRENDQDSQQVRAYAAAAARAMLAALPLAAGWAAFRASIRDALAAGQAEGIVAAVAIAADKAGQGGLDWDAGFERAYQQLERLGQVWLDADLWAQRTVARAEQDLARLLADRAEAGASYDEMLDASMGLLDADEVDAVGFTTDWAMTTAAAAGALSLFQQYGAAQVEWITAGDGRVCAVCDDNETNSPYPPDAVPECPAHPRCRCQLSATFDLSAFAAWFTN